MNEPDEEEKKCNTQLWWLLPSTLLPISKIIVGFVCVNVCANSKHIPIYLIVGGLLDCVFLAFFFQESKCVRLISLAIGIFLFAWLILGAVWIFPHFRKEENCGSAELNKFIFMITVAEHVITLAFIVGGLTKLIEWQKSRREVPDP